MVVQFEHGFSQPAGAAAELPTSLYQGGSPGSHRPHGQLPGSHGAPAKHPVQLFVDARQSTPPSGSGLQHVRHPSSVGAWHVSKSFQGAAAASHPHSTGGSNSPAATAHARIYRCPAGGGLVGYGTAATSVAR